MVNGVVIDVDTEELSTWAYVEIMGHSRIAGRISERKFGVNVMLQIDVPDGESGFSHTELFGPSGRGI